MPKIITSPIKKWPGTVTISDPLTLPQVEPIEAALETFEGMSKSEQNRTVLAAVLGCVEAWNLEGFPASPTLETIPLSPRRSASSLIKWIWDEVFKIYWEEEEVPNE